MINRSRISNITFLATFGLLASGYCQAKQSDVCQKYDDLDHFVSKMSLSNFSNNKAATQIAIQKYQDLYNSALLQSQKNPTDPCLSQALTVLGPFSEENQADVKILGSRPTATNMWHNFCDRFFTLKSASYLLLDYTQSAGSKLLFKTGGLKFLIGAFTSHPEIAAEGFLLPLATLPVSLATSLVVDDYLTGSYGMNGLATTLQGLPARSQLNQEDVTKRALKFLNTVQRLKKSSVQSCNVTTPSTPIGSFAKVKSLLPSGHQALQSTAPAKSHIAQ